MSFYVIVGGGGIKLVAPAGSSDRYCDYIEDAQCYRTFVRASRDVDSESGETVRSVGLGRHDDIAFPKNLLQ